MKNKDDISAYTGIDNISNCQEFKAPTKLQIRQAHMKDKVKNKWTNQLSFFLERGVGAMLETMSRCLF